MFPSSFSGVEITFFRFCLFLFHLYKRKHILVNKNPNDIEPIIEPIITDDFNDGGAGVDVVDDAAGIGDGDVGVDGGDVGVDGGDTSKELVHLNSLLLLMSSNKISLSFDRL